MEQILLIEDNAALRETLGDTLRNMGFDVHDAGNGSEALVLAASPTKNIDLVISDLVMPGMNAMELFEALQDRSYSGKMLVITRYPMPHTGMSLVSRPNVTWARKPIGFEELRLILAQMLETRPVAAAGE